METTHCDSIEDLKEYISEKPYVDYCPIEIDDPNYVPKNAWDEIEVPISQGMRTYLVEWCDDLEDEESEVAAFEVDEPLLNDLQYIAEQSHIAWNWDEVREQLKPYAEKAVLVLT